MHVSRLRDNGILAAVAGHNAGMTGAFKRAAYPILALALGALGVYGALEYGGWTWLALSFFFLPDAALFFGMGADLPRGAIHPRAVLPYNALHSFIGPVVLGLAGVGLPPLAWTSATFWAAHIAMDRAVGYGLRTREGTQRPATAPRP